MFGNITKDVSNEMGNRGSKSVICITVKEQRVDGLRPRKIFEGGLRCTLVAIKVV